MVNISEISDDSNDGGDPNKKPEELDKKPKEEAVLRSTRNENRNKKPEEEDVEEEEDVAEEKEEEEERRSTSFPLPNDVTEALVALIRRCDYPSLSSVSRYFSGLIASSSLYETRARLGLSETFLYASIRYSTTNDLQSWHILHRNKASSLRLTKLGSLPPVPWGASVVTIGLEMYVIGGIIDLTRSKVMNVIDCRTHKCRSLPPMRRGRNKAAAGVIDGKIYVIGGFRKRCPLESEWIEVFDLEKQIWESLPGPYPESSTSSQFRTYVVMEDKIYILDYKGCLVYEPKRRRGDEWDASAVGAAHPIKNMWKESFAVQCVVDDMLYTVDRRCTLGHPIVVYDPKEKTWRPVKGESLRRLPNYIVHPASEMANFGGKLAILGSKRSYVHGDCIGREKGIWCAMIVLEKREGGEIWGNVESLDCVLGGINHLTVRLCRTLTI
ncbi:PREDICTED: kelch repeat-containing protein At1g19470-like [Camelina sativa]|uniref:Kelch repeat-containing protein At1g19470-like n=1 Tax=Camelina sativa TaxID=90675 RepID=A0ABM0VQ78_CAMSA|nr:PREDICTED: kelch repeat-containing protein At1g19470-like [Camelina sativa]XP_010459617.1 PREDICTED: kelch repeat-containing protein At1g19470-like [Camelina sativa]